MNLRFFLSYLKNKPANTFYKVIIEKISKICTPP